VRAQQTLCLLFQERSDELLVFHHAQGREAVWEHYTNAKEFEIPVFSSQALNERYYGDLQGLNKEETAQKYGALQVQQWRRSFDIEPPGGESLKDTASRSIPYFTQHILPFLQHGKNVVVAAHGNSLRSIMMHLEKLTPEQVSHLELPTAVPVLYDIDEHGSVRSKEILT
jgi:2,3-bisphosphoglycerate-dependent phosphoglycerate mutase